MDPHTNALVSVFLRELEHYEGILFLTTNRMQTFDPAILSRIHLPLRYDPLKQEAREAIWRCFVERAGTTAGSPLYTDEVIETLAKKKLNGREVSDNPTISAESNLEKIRNAVLVARSIAEHDKNVVDETYLRDSVEARKQLDEDFQGAGATENMNSYV